MKNELILTLFIGAFMIKHCAGVDRLVEEHSEVKRLKEQINIEELLNAEIQSEVSQLPEEYRPNFLKIAGAKGVKVKIDQMKAELTNARILLTEYYEKKSKNGDRQELAKIKRELNDAGINV